MTYLDFCGEKPLGFTYNRKFLTGDLAGALALFLYLSMIVYACQ